MLSESITKFKWAIRLIEINGMWPIGRLRQKQENNTKMNLRDIEFAIIGWIE